MTELLYSPSLFIYREHIFFEHIYSSRFEQAILVESVRYFDNETVAYALNDMIKMKKPSKLKQLEGF
ncbi:hypothetical protein SAMN04488522_101277 [Pedobacter caeni]|uniref:Uncharacterized protein n=1 Tax=Pedobacter caeni TaxID=288992 RepID=A0A1M4TQ77_9SPHI|nr:hypothetical protein SAMN04488522_101277 [Pedobacter caeni]